MKWYQIFDVRKPLLDDDYEIEARNSSEAVSKYLTSINDTYQAKRSGDNNCHIKATPFIVKDGQKYFSGRSTWYQLYV